MTVFENAVVKLAAAALRLRVLHQHVVVEMLTSSADEKSVDQALGALTRENGMDVVAHQAAAQKNGVR